MSNILLSKSNFQIKDSFTEKQVPFLYKGSPSPSEMRVSESEFPSSVSGSLMTREEVDNLPGFSRAPYSGGADDWGNPVTRASFSGNHLQVSSLSESEDLSNRSEDLPSDENLGAGVKNWSNLNMSKSGTSMVVSNYSTGQLASSMSRKILLPWRESWDQINVENLTGTNNLSVSHISSVVDVLNGVITLEPTERSWTSSGTIIPAYNYPYSTGTYDLEITSPSQHAGMYVILNQSSSGLDRKWIMSESKKAVCWNPSNFRWQVISYSSADAENNTITTTGNPHMTQYIQPFSTQWFYGVTNNLNSMKFQKLGSDVLKRPGSDPFGEWTGMNGANVSGFSEDSSSGGDGSKFFLTGTKYRKISSNAMGLTGNWEGNITVIQSGSDLIVSGFDRDDVNGTYDLFTGSDEGRIWLHLGDGVKYSISYDGSDSTWKLYTTVDGEYAIVDNSKTGVFRTWAEEHIDKNGPLTGFGGSEALQILNGEIPVHTGTTTVGGNTYKSYRKQSTGGENSTSYYTLFRTLATVSQDNTETKECWVLMHTNTSQTIGNTLSFTEWKNYVFMYSETDDIEKAFFSANPSYAGAITGSFSGFYFTGSSNTVFFDRYQNSWMIKEGKSIGLKFSVASGSDSSAIWKSGDYTMKYSPQDYVWKMYDSANNVLTVQDIKPTSWDDFDPETNYENTIIDWINCEVKMSDAPFRGSYVDEGFSSDISPFSMSKDMDVKSYYATFDRSGCRWKLSVKLSIDGEYTLTNGSEEMKNRIWRKNGVLDSYKILYNSSASRWEVKDYTSDDGYDHSVTNTVLPDPFEAEWDLGAVKQDVSEDSLLVTDISGDFSDAVGAYSLEYHLTTDLTFVSGKTYYIYSAGSYAIDSSWTAGSPVPANTYYEKPLLTDRTWKRTGSSGEYTILWSGEDSKWILKFLNTLLNTTYPKISGTGKTSIWRKTISGLQYTIQWNDELYRWEMILGDGSLVSNSLGSSYDTLEDGWADCSVAFSGENITISGLSNQEANGTYSLIPSSLRTSDMEKMWTKESSDESSLFRLSYDFTALKWKIVEENIDFNGSYDPYGTGEGLDREWRRLGKKEDTDGNVIAYLIDYDFQNSRWQIRRQNNYLHTLDQTASGSKEYFVYVSEAESYGKLTIGTNYSSGGTEATGNVTVSGTTYSIGTIGIENWFELVPVISYQTSPDVEPYGGEWLVGEVIDPFSNADVYHVGVSYTPLEKQDCNYIISGNERTESSRSRYNSRYTLIDSTKTAGERKWKSLTGDTYIIWTDNRWVLTSDKNLQNTYDMEYRSDDVICAWTNQDASLADCRDLSKLTWSTNYYTFYGTFKISAVPMETSGKNKPFWIVALSREGTGSATRYRASNIERIYLSTQGDDIVNVSMSLIGSSGSQEFTGFLTDEDGNYFPTDLVMVKFSAYSLNTIRVSFSGITIPGYDADHDFMESGLGVIARTGRLAESKLGSSDMTYNIVMTVMDAAGNSRQISKKITHISRLWRMGDTNIKQDANGYSTKVMQISSTGGEIEIPKTKLNDSSVPERKWNDIFYPETHGYPVDENGNIDEDNAIRISQTTIDPAGKTGPTSDELTKYDRLTLSSDGKSLSTDSDGRYITNGWNRSKLYNRMESSSYGANGENLRYWIIDNTGYQDFKLEFEYFDLSSQVSSSPKNIMSPYEGDVLVIYDASAEGCTSEETDEYGNKKLVLQDSSKLVELYAFTGSHYNEDISMRSDSSAVFDLKDFGFVTPNINTTSKICLILYTDNDYQLSGFKIKAGPGHVSTIYNYEMNNKTGEIWIHIAPGSASEEWSSPSKVRTSHQFTTSNATMDQDRSRVIFDSDPGNTITGDFTMYGYLTNHHDLVNDVWVPGCSQPESLHRVIAGASSWVYPQLSTFLLYNDDCVDYYDISTCVIPNGTDTNYSSIYDWVDQSKNFGKIVSKITSNKDKGTITFTSGAPLGRLFSSYSYHTYYRLTNDGYGDLYFYDNSLVPSSDYSITGLKDWTYVDLMIYNEGSNALAEGLMKFLSRGYLTGSGSTQTITQVVDENRPWDVQSGTVAETVNQTGAAFNQSFTALPAKTRAAAMTTISSSSGGVSLGSSLAARAKAYLRIYWCLAKSVNGSSVTYVTTTRGKKLWSSEISGKYFVVTM